MSRHADRLGIDYYVWDFSGQFHDRVVDDFVTEYAAGRTPNPCVRCNERVKYAALLARARALGFDALATGHHLRLEHRGGRWRMLRAADEAKDQTYVLYMANQDQLAHTRWPVSRRSHPRSPTGRWVVRRNCGPPRDRPPSWWSTSTATTRRSTTSATGTPAPAAP